MERRAEKDCMMTLLPTLASTDLSGLKQAPTATILILLLTITLNLVVGFLGRRSINLTEYRTVSTESRVAQQELMTAMKSGNQRRISKAQKQQQETSQKMLKVTGKRTKTQFLYIIPLFLLWPVLRNFFGNATIAYMPFKSPFFSLELKMGGWYILCSIASSIIIQRVLGLTFEIDPKGSAGIGENG